MSIWQYNANSNYPYEYDSTTPYYIIHKANQIVSL
jgi:hypothetical protein